MNRLDRFVRDYGLLIVAFVVVALVAIGMGLADSPPAAPPPFCASTTAPAAEHCRGGTP